MRATCRFNRYFYPRSPCGERLQQRLLPTWQPYFYPRSPCGERRRVVVDTTYTGAISIHALLAESDTLLDGMRSGGRSFLSTLSLRRATVLRPGRDRGVEISIHALLAESDRMRWPMATQARGFLSTLSLRRATFPGTGLRQISCISIHALLAESDLPGKSWPTSTTDFYPRSPCGERLVGLQTTTITVSFLSTLSLRRATQYNRPTRCKV